MASFGTEDVEKLVTCPYDPHHRLRKCRLQAHITKCKKQATEEKKTCPFNAQHQIPGPEYQHHLEICENRAVMDRRIAKYTDEGEIDLPKNSEVSVVVAENWENEMCRRAAPGYDPKHAQKRIIFKDTSGMLPSEKKKFYRSLYCEDEEEEEVLPEPEKPADNDTRTLKELRQPRDVPEVMKFRSPEAQFSSLGLGRAQPLGSRRIAANFSGLSKDHNESESLGRGIGRGFPSNEP